MADNGQFIHDIYLLFISLAQQDNEKTIQRIFLEALNTILPGCDFVLSPTPNVEQDSMVEAITIGTNQFGYLIANQHFLELSPQYQSVIRNSGQLLALLFENIQQRKLLGKENSRLDQMVKEKTHDLEEERSRLAERVEERTAELTTAYLKLQEALHARDLFLANVSHELRTPLTAILGNAELLQMQASGELNKKQQKYVNTIYQSGQHLHHLISDILALTKLNVEAVQLHKRDVNIDDFCQNCLNLMDTMAQRKKIAIHYRNSCTNKHIHADETRFKQILVNLLTNAIKFTLHDGSIGLHVRENGENSVEFDIWDTGIGISESDQKKLFQPFVQLDNHLERTYDGSGLGLTIALKMAELHGGTINVHSQPGAGSHFVVQIPR